MPIPMRFESTLASFSQSVAVTDYTCAYAADTGVWGERLKETRSISGIVLAMREEDLQLYNSGNNVAAGITITTKQALYFPVTGDTTGNATQSYVDYLGLRYKVSGSGLFSINTAYNLYHAIRFLD